jgi:signal transduction histidine kinase
MTGDLVFARDITEKKRHQQIEQELEAQLRQQQKLEAIGTLAGGVAHEINNPLNGIMNYAQLILDASDKDSNSAVYSSENIHETERISVIVKNLLQFSRHEKQSHSYASIYDIINQTISLVNTIIKKDQIKLDMQLDENLPDIKCRSQQIQQVIMNLLTNARDALNEKYPEYNENKIILLSCTAYQSEGRRWLRLSVHDNGVGIPQELKDRIYEPFFSTKPKETGTGLGLSISYGIISEHHGKITFESEVGKYTTFILDLPVDNGWSL